MQIKSWTLCRLPKNLFGEHGQGSFIPVHFPRVLPVAEEQNQTRTLKGFNFLTNGYNMLAYIYLDMNSTDTHD